MNIKVIRTIYKKSFVNDWKFTKFPNNEVLVEVHFADGCKLKSITGSGDWLTSTSDAGGQSIPGLEHYTLTSLLAMKCRLGHLGLDKKRYEDYVEKLVAAERWMLILVTMITDSTEVGTF